MIFHTHTHTFDYDNDHVSISLISNKSTNKLKAIKIQNSFKGKNITNLHFEKFWVFSFIIVVVIININIGIMNYFFLMEETLG